MIVSPSNKERNYEALLLWRHARAILAGGTISAGLDSMSCKVAGNYEDFFYIVDCESDRMHCFGQIVYHNMAVRPYEGLRIARIRKGCK